MSTQGRSEQKRKHESPRTTAINVVLSVGTRSARTAYEESTRSDTRVGVAGAFRPQEMAEIVDRTKMSFRVFLTSYGAHLISRVFR